MEGFKKKLQKRQIWFSFAWLFACVVSLASRIFEKDSVASESLQGFASGFQAGILLALVGVLVFLSVRNATAMRNPEELKKLYVSETDERKGFIRQKSGSAGMNIVMYGLAVGTIVAGNINTTAFLTLLGATFFVSLVRVVLKLYCRNKY